MKRWLLIVAAVAGLVLTACGCTSPTRGSQARTGQGGARQGGGGQGGAGQARAGQAVADQTAQVVRVSTTALPGGLTWTNVPVGKLPGMFWPVPPGVTGTAPSGYGAVIDDVAVLTSSDVWVSGRCVLRGQVALPPAGGGDVIPQAVTGIAGHWNGRAWRWWRMPVPDVLGLRNGGDDLIAATSDHDVWVVPGAPLAWGNGNTSLVNVALHFDGQRWTEQASGVPSGYGFAALAASRAAGTWAIVWLHYDPGAGGNPYAKALIHWTGTSWQRVPFPPLTSTYFSPGELAIGPGAQVWVGGQSRSLKRSQPLLAWYTAAAGWRDVSVPVLAANGGTEDGLLLAGRTMWAIIDPTVPSASQVLVNLDEPWIRTTRPSRAEGPELIGAGDGQGRLYVISALAPGVIADWTGAAWRQVYPPLPAGAYTAGGDGCLEAGSWQKGWTPPRGVFLNTIASGGSVIWAAGYIGDGAEPLYPTCLEPTAEPFIGFLTAGPAAG